VLGIFSGPVSGETGPEGLFQELRSLLRPGKALTIASAGTAWTITGATAFLFEYQKTNGRTALVCQ
jgi:hypothetical protein